MSSWDIVPDAFVSPRDSLAFPFSIGGVEPEIPTTTYASVEDTSRNPDAPVESLPIHLRGPGHLRLAHEAARGGDLRASLAFVDSALATLGDDPLSWRHRAVLARLLGERDEDSPELANAHALSPLEPVLKAEAFLSMLQTHGREPSAMLKSLAQDADALHECVHLYIEANLFQEAARLIDEALRHGEHPLLRYMSAWMLMTHTRMEMEAANEVAKAGKSPIEPPFPWRPLEVEAVQQLAMRFPKDERLKTLKTLLDKRSSPAT